MAIPQHQPDEQPIEPAASAASPPKPVRKIDTLWAFLVAVAVLGPFALPLLWRNPRFDTRTKVLATLGVLALTWALTKFMTEYLPWILARTML